MNNDNNGLNPNNPMDSNSVPAPEMPATPAPEMPTASAPEMPTAPAPEVPTAPAPEVPTAPAPDANASMSMNPQVNNQTPNDNPNPMMNQPVNNPNMGMNQMNVEPEKKKNTKFIIIVAALVVVIIVAVVLILGKGKSNQSSEGGNTNPTPTPVVDANTTTYSGFKFTNPAGYNVTVTADYLEAMKTDNSAYFRILYAPYENYSDYVAQKDQFKSQLELNGMTVTNVSETLNGTKMWLSFDGTIDGRKTITSITDFNNGIVATVIIPGNNNINDLYNVINNMLDTAVSDGTSFAPEGEAKGININLTNIPAIN